MILLIFVIGISAAKGGPRPDEMDFNITSPDYDYVTTLDMFDLLQGLLMKNQSTEVHTMTADFDNITHTTNNNTFIQIVTRDDTLQITGFVLSIFSILLNIFTIFILSKNNSFEKTYSAAQTVDTIE